MSVDGGISGSARQVLVLAVRDVEVSLRVAVFLGQTEVNNIDLVSSLANSHQEVVRLDIAVDEGFGMNVLDAGDELISEEKNRLERELSVAEVEEVLQAGSEEVENHGIIVALCAEPTNKGNAHTTGERLVDTSLIFELWVLGLDALKLDSDLLARNNVSTEIDVTERAGANLSADAVLVADAKILQRLIISQDFFHREMANASNCR
jgi:hypothetical protein